MVKVSFRPVQPLNMDAMMDAQVAEQPGESVLKVEVTYQPDQ